MTPAASCWSLIAALVFGAIVLQLAVRAHTVKRERERHHRQAHDLYRRFGGSRG